MDNSVLTKWNILFIRNKHKREKSGGGRAVVKRKREFRNPLRLRILLLLSIKQHQNRKLNKRRPSPSIFEKSFLLIRFYTVRLEFKSSAIGGVVVIAFCKNTDHLLSGRSQLAVFQIFSNFSFLILMWVSLIFRFWFDFFLILFVFLVPPLVKWRWSQKPGSQESPCSFCLQLNLIKLVKK